MDFGNLQLLFSRNELRDPWRRSPACLEELVRWHRGSCEVMEVKRRKLNTLVDGRKAIYFFSFSVFFNATF